MAKTSVHLKACDIAASEAHNKREKTLDYVKSDLSHLNESYNYTGNSLQTELANIKREVKEKTGRKLQKNAIPLKEGVVVIDGKTTMGDIRKYCEECRKKFGIRPLQIHIHRDEGHVNSAEWKPNLHAHIVWIMYDENGRNVRLSRQDCRDMQTMAADTLGMERGKSSDKRHLSSLQFKIQQQEQRIAELETELKGKTETEERLKGVFEGAKQGVSDLFSGKVRKRAEKAEKSASEATEALLKANLRGKDLEAKTESLERELNKKNRMLEDSRNYANENKRLEDDNRKLDQFIKDSASLGLTALQMVELRSKRQIKCDSFRISGNDVRRTDGTPVLLRLKEGVIEVLNFGWQKTWEFCRDVVQNVWYSINGISNERSKSRGMER